MQSFKQFFTEAKHTSGTYPGPTPADHKTNKEWKAAVKGQVGFKGRPLAHELDKHAAKFGKVVKKVVGKTAWEQAAPTDVRYHYDDGGHKDYMKDSLGSYHHWHKVSVLGFRKGPLVKALRKQGKLDESADEVDGFRKAVWKGWKEDAYMPAPEKHWNDLSPEDSKDFHKHVHDVRMHAQKHKISDPHKALEHYSDHVSSKWAKTFHKGHTKH